MIMILIIPRLLSDQSARHFADIPACFTHAALYGTRRKDAKNDQPDQRKSNDPENASSGTAIAISLRGIRLSLCDTARLTVCAFHICCPG